MTTTDVSDPCRYNPAQSKPSRAGFSRSGLTRTRRSLRGIALVCLLAGFAGCSDSNNSNGGVANAPPPNTTTVTVSLNPLEVVGGGTPGASGTASITVNLDDLTFTGTVTLAGLTATGVSLNQGFAGDNGAVLVSFLEDSATQWSVPANALLTQADLDALNAGSLYITVTTAAAPAGALRGQLLTGNIELLFTLMTGAEEVPPVVSAGSATAAVTLNPTTGALVVHINAEGLDDAVASHVHEALAGANGPVLVELLPDPGNVGHWQVEDAVLSSAELDTLNTGGLYLNLHTPANPPGEVRGQIQPEGIEILFTDLLSSEVVPPANSTNSGVAATTIRTADMVATINVNHIGIDAATSVTVQQAPAGQNGPEVFGLTRDPNNLAHWSLDDETIPPATYTALRNQGLYLLTRSPGFPAGEVRGQLEPEQSTPPPADTFFVESVTPANSATVDTLPAVITVSLNRSVDPDSVQLADFELLASGGDGSFADGNELGVTIVDALTADTDITLDLTGATDAEDVYRLTLADINDTAGVVLDGDSDGNPGGTFATSFTVESPVAAPTLTDIQNNIFTPSCAVSGCHTGGSPAAGMNLSAGQAFSNIVNVASAQVGSLDRIEPGDPDNSYLIRKVEGTGQLGRMPLGQPPLSSQAIRDLRDWVEAGAANN